MQYRSRVVASVASLAGSAALSLALVGCGSMMHSRPLARGDFWGFTAPWDARSAASVAAHGSQLDAIVSGFIELDTVTLRPASPYEDTLARHSAGNRRYMALLTSYAGSRFHPEIIRALAADSTVLGHVAGASAALISGMGYRGLVLDFEGMTPDDFNALMSVTKAFADSARAHGVSPVGIALPAMDTVSYPARPFLTSLDFVVVMLYDQHWSTSPPGAIASPEWVARALGMRVGDVGPSRVIAALPVYGYDWRSDSATSVVSYADVVKLATDEHVPLVRDPASATLHAQGRYWQAWVSDAVLLDSLVSVGRRLGVTKFALWRLGLEDPRIWPDVVK